MMFTRPLSYRRMFSAVFAAIALLLAPVSCTTVERRIDRAAAGPNGPSDTTIQMRLAPAGPPEEIPGAVPPSGPLQVTITQAVLLSLENNRSLIVQRSDPAIRQTAEDRERAVFDPAVDAEISTGREKAERLARSGSETEDFDTDTGQRHHFS